MTKEPAARLGSVRAVLAALAEAGFGGVQQESIEIRESYLWAAAFVGRKVELAQLTGALNAAMAGQGSGWLVAGESGVGKSRLLDELRIQALVNGALVVRGQAISEGASPYQMWRTVLATLVLQTEISEFEASVLQGIVPDIGHLLGYEVADAPEIEAQANYIRLLNVLAAVFERQTEPLLIMLEDLQWVTEDLLVLKRLLAQVPSLPLLVVGTFPCWVAPFRKNRWGKGWACWGKLCARWGTGCGRSAWPPICPPSGSGTSRCCAACLSLAR